MALKIISASDPLPVTNIVLTAYAQPGLGKTSLAFTAENPLCLDADKGSYRASNRKDTAIIATWSDVAFLTPQDLEPYSTVILDTGGRILDKLRTKLLAEDPKNAGTFGGMSGKGWNNMVTNFSALVNKVLEAKKDLVILCHMDEKAEGETTKERIDVAGQSKNEIHKLSDAMCRIVVDARGDRFLDFDPREGGTGKNPAQLPKVPFLHPSKYDKTLADVIRQIKEAINHMTAEQAEARKEQDRWASVIADVKTVAEFNGLLPEARKSKNLAIQSMILAAAKERKYVYEGDKKSGKYVEAA